MRYSKVYLSICILIIIGGVSSYGQLAQTEQVFFDVAPVFSKTVSDDQLASAETLSDIYEGYPSSWINNYISTTLVIGHDETQTSADGSTEALSKEQKRAIIDAPIGSQVSIWVVHEHSEKQEDSPQEIKLTTTVVPTESATFGESHEDLLGYIREKAINAIDQNPAATFDQAIISFTISEEGEVTDPKLEESSLNTFIDKLLLDSIKTMPDWTPANDKNGRAIPQRFEFRVGNSLGC